LVPPKNFGQQWKRSQRKLNGSVAGNIDLPAKFASLAAFVA
jgi:hypothetical protein